MDCLVQGIEIIADVIGHVYGGLTSEDLNLTEMGAYFIYNHPPGEGGILAVAASYSSCMINPTAQ
jgi:hypothetical protein